MSAQADYSKRAEQQFQRNSVSVLTAALAVSLVALLCALSPVFVQVAYADELQATNLDPQGVSNLMPGDLVYFGRYFQNVVSDQKLVDKLNDMDYQTLYGKNCWELEGVRFTENQCYPDDYNWHFYSESPIRWYVISADDDSYTLISEKVLDKQVFQDVEEEVEGSEEGIFWGKCTLRRWLNDGFANLAFNADERNDLLETTVSFTEQSYYDYWEGIPSHTNNSTDRVYLLSSTEVPGVLTTANIPIIANGTQYAIAEDSSIEAPTRWWLRGNTSLSYGYEEEPFVTADGELDWFYPTYGRGIRPVIRVSKNAAGLSREEPAGPGAVASDPEDLTLKFALYHYGQEPFVKEVDVLRTAHSIEPDHEAFDLTVKCVSNKAQTYMLFSGKKKIAESKSGQFKNLDPSKFKALEEISVITKGASKSLKTRLLLEVKDKSIAIPKSVSFLGSGLSITLNDDIPLVGGRTVSLETPSFPASVLVEDGKLKIGVNIAKENLYSSNSYEGVTTTTYKRKSIAEQMESWRTKAYKSTRILDDMQGYLEQGNLAADVPFAEGSTSVSFMGYFETEWSDRIDSIHGQFMLILSGNKTFQTQTVIVFVPVTFSVKCSASLSTGAAATLTLSPKFGFAGDFTTSLRGSLEPYAGLGVGQWVSVGVYGAVGCSTSIVWLSSSEPQGWRDLRLSGECGAKAYFAMKELKAKLFSLKDLRKNKKFGPFVKGDDLLIWSRDGEGIVNKLSNKKSSANSALSVQADLYANPDSYSELIRMGSPKQMRMLDGSDVLVDDAYPAAAPQIASVDGCTVVAYVDIDPTRAEPDQSMLKYAVYYEDTAEFTEALPVSDNYTADMQPAFYRDGNDLYVCYLDSRKAFGEGDGLELSEYAKSFGVVVEKFNPDSGLFENLGHVDRNSRFFRYCYAPSISSTGEGLQCIWAENDEGNMFGVGGTNSIRYSVYDEDGWSNPRVLTEGPSPVTGTACGMLGDEPAVAYVLDGDSDLTTSDGMLYLVCADEKPKLIAQGDITNPVFGDLNGESVLAYCNGGALMKLTSDSGDAEEFVPAGAMGSSCDFMLRNGSVYFSKTTDGARNVMKLVAGEDGWSAVPLTRETAYVDSFSMDDGKLLYLVSEVDTESENLDSTAQIKLLDSLEIHDLVIDGVNFDHEQIAPGNELEVAFDVTNNGTTYVNEVEIGLRKAGDSEPLATDAFYVELAPGDAFEGVAKLRLPDDFEANEYEVVAYEPGFESKEVEDDETTVDFGKADVEVNASYAIEEGNRYLVTIVKNTGQSIASTRTSIRDEDGDELDCYADDLEPGASVTYRYLLDEYLFEGPSGSVVTVAAETDADEYYESNNVDAVRVWDIPLSDPVEIDNEKADEVAELIAGLPDLSSLTETDSVLVKKARQLYDSLTDEQKMLVSDVFVELEKAENRIADMGRTGRQSKSKASNTLSAKAKSKVLTVKYKKLKKKAQTIKASKAFAVSRPQGAVTYVKLSGNKKISVSKAGKITIKKKGLKKGKKYTVKVMVIAAGNAYYLPATRTVTLKIKVK